jgi:hypothetical protein
MILIKPCHSVHHDPSLHFVKEKTRGCSEKAKSGNRNVGRYKKSRERKCPNSGCKISSREDLYAIRCKMEKTKRGVEEKTQANRKVETKQKLQAAVTISPTVVGAILGGGGSGMQKGSKG